MDDKIFLNYLFIAVPELRADASLLRLLQKSGLVTQSDVDAAVKISKTFKKYNKLAASMKSKSLVERLMSVAPEILSISSVDLMRKFGLIDNAAAHALRLSLRAAKASMALPSEATIIARGNAVFGNVFSNETIDLIRALDNAKIEALRAEILARTGKEVLSTKDVAELKLLAEKSIKRAQELRSGIATFSVFKDALEKAKSADTILQALYLIGPDLLTPAMISQMRRAGVISARTAAIMTDVLAIGKTAWRNFAKAAATENLAARILLISQGVITHELVNFMLENGVISKRQADLLRPMVSALRVYTKGKIDDILDTGRRYRVLPGENPINTFARGSRKTDQHILKEIAKAAKAAEKEATRLLELGGSGNRTRANQLRITRKALHDVMHELWENQGMLTIFGESEAARFAQASMSELEDKLWRKYGKGDGIRKSLQLQARAGVDSYVSRHENLIQLSRRVYKNRDLALNRIDTIINQGLLQGKSAREIAADVARFIDPKVPGGVRHAAMRLARTEINNAFHYTSIRYTREMPWVTGYKWHLSGSHPKPDECNQYAERDHSGMGSGVFSKRDVPGKPHPHCLCFVTAVTVSPDQFAVSMRKGRYKNYLSGFTG